MRLGNFNPRQRYLTGLGILSPRQMRHQMRLSRLGAFDPRRRYLRGLGQDSDFDYTESNDISPVVPPFTPVANPAPVIGGTTYLPLPTAGISPTGPSSGILTSGGLPVASIGAAGQIVPLVAGAAAAAPASSASFWSGSTLGLPNSTLILGLGGIALLALLAGGSSGRSR